MAESLANLQKGDELVNRPDLWAVNTEYDFGGGLYGKRYTGTLSVTTSAAAFSVDAGFTGTRIINCGGQVILNEYHVTLQFPFCDQGTYVQLQINSGLKVTAKATANTSVPYDIWILYTKS